MKIIHVLAVIPYLCTAAALAADNLPPVQRTQYGAPKCPTDLDIKNMETRMSARVIPAKNRVALEAEHAKAHLCRRAGTEYTPDDWKRMKAVTRGDD